MYKIELSNGNVIENVKINGGMCSTAQEIDESTFSGGLSSIRITHVSNDPEDELCAMTPGVYERMKLVYVYADRWEQGTYKFLFDRLNDAEFERMKLDARLTYLEMITEEE